MSSSTTSPNIAQNAASIPGLEKLRDIHLPEPVSWWPPAPGWWILAALILLAIAVFVRWSIKNTRQRRYRKLALRQLQTLYENWQQQRDDFVFAQAINRLLKQTALAAFPVRDVAALSGVEWLEFLDQKLKKPQFAQTDLRALATLHLREPAPIAADVLHRAAKQWIRSHRC